jgi:hypothetical protein
MTIMYFLNIAARLEQKNVFFMPNFSKLPSMTFWPFIVKNMNVNMGAISKSLPQSNVCLEQPQILDLDQNVTNTITIFQNGFV